ncbi:MAG: 5-formyltetrahydrofolate cyclo-ligase [Bacteroidaceae bacterium]|nr:5-formyltetrahydrofolate cyclo-ligase [Bacteroidaceae bacterium]
MSVQLSSVETKSSLRESIRTLKAQYDAAQLATLSAMACHTLLTHPRWSRAHGVLLYASLPDEVDTTSLISCALQEGKRVFLPVVEGGELYIKAYSGQTVIGPYGIREPVGERLLDYSQIDLAVIPGMAFDRQGHRLGRGKGYYDRLLPALSAYRIGLCFPFQLVESVPVDSHDCLVDEVIAQ